jgi:hypothetical protein
MSDSVYLFTRSTKISTNESFSFHNHKPLLSSKNHSPNLTRDELYSFLSNLSPSLQAEHGGRKTNLTDVLWQFRCKCKQCFANSDRNSFAVYAYPQFFRCDLYSFCPHLNLTYIEQIGLDFKFQCSSTVSEIRYIRSHPF